MTGRKNGDTMTMSQGTDPRKSGAPFNLASIFQDLLERHVSQLRIRGLRATGLALCHDDRHPSFSANLERCVWFCFTCNRGGGVRDFALLVGEPWGAKHSE